MTKEDAKEMIKLVATDKGLVDVESVMKILDRIDTGNSDLSYAPGVRDTPIDRIMSDKDMFRIHPESDPIYEKAPWWMNPDVKIPEPTCYTSKASTGDSLPTTGYTTCKCCDD